MIIIIIIIVDDTPHSVFYCNIVTYKRNNSARFLQFDRFSFSLG